MKEEALRTQLVQDCKTINELKSVLDTLVEVEGSHSTYTAEQIKDKIDLIQEHLSNRSMFTSISWNWLTRTHGIRAKCMELFWYKLFE